ncbi:hypothetical protein A2943_01660 [Candidatus Adlerbacteria bacterium RIFCSPLOWO2_01_FULL_51_16]|uniref:DUF5678 domain-containing protein n=1 Tax=Candidatus Adlerbacteria bacterium RIFCSPLOWO2_01_FULL_51_16 TaxID=1797243 RepID=A0A1F4XEH1_9BACT|nr:MAG: hypothetical protein A2943_01660 [Candidatus Adlerbacteria bacterium RIFCSPLOWO2_01_FULL_51_16]
MRTKPTEAEREAYTVEFHRRATLARKEGEKIREILEPKLVAEGLEGRYVYVDIYTGEYVVGEDSAEAFVNARKKFPPDHLGWGFDVGGKPSLIIGGASWPWL